MNYILFPIFALFLVACGPNYATLHPYDAHGNLQMIVEIPVGSTAKFELNKHSWRLEQDIKNGKPRFVQYLGYPAHYGMIPGTLLPIAQGGDGDPLDVVLLGGTFKRGQLVSIRLIGVIYLLDGGENDHKLIAVVPGGVFGNVHDLPDLESHFPGVSQILTTFFSFYKGTGHMTFLGLGNLEQAQIILNKAILPN
jgi:inorganic pyrophosphatase